MRPDEGVRAVKGDGFWLDVALSPSLLPGGDAAHARTVYVVVDVIRATTTLCVLFERGCQRVYVAGSVAAARSAAGQARGAASSVPALLAGEVGGLRPPGFDYGNSPAEFAAVDLVGKEIIFATTNGTRALHACRGGAAVLAGALRNATALARAAVTLVGAVREPAEAAEANAKPALDGEETPDGDDYAGPGIVIVCSGRSQAPAFDDTICAGYLAASIEHEAAHHGQRAQRREGTRIALATLAAAQQEGIERSLATSGAAVAIAELGLAGDIPWCAAIDTGTAVPMVLSHVADASDASDAHGEHQRDTVLVMEAWQP